MNRQARIASTLLIVVVLGGGAGLAAWKADSLEASRAASAHQPEPMESVTASIAEPYALQASTTVIGTVLATRSVTLRNELEGTVAWVALDPGRVVEVGTVLVRLDVSVEQAELAALEAQGALAATVLERNRQAGVDHAVSDLEIDRARAELAVAKAQIDRTRAIIERKTMRAPFRARIGLSDVHSGQFLDTGTELTSLQGVDDSIHVDFSVAQAVAAGLEPGDPVTVMAGEQEVVATVVAVDARIDPATRTALVRARIDGPGAGMAPGASVRVEAPIGEPSPSVVVPASALRRGPEGDHVFVLAEDAEGATRAGLRFVQAGGGIGNHVVIRGGLAAGERVAASGSFKLRESVLVAVQDEPASGPSSR